MSAVLSESKNELIKQVAQCQGFADYEVEVKAGSMKGDGYLGIINTVRLQDKKNTLHLIMKSAMTGEKLREAAPVRKAYEREIYMYQKVFPELRRFSEQNSIRTRFEQTARCYGSLFEDKEECIVLENLKEADFRLWNRMRPMDEGHVTLVFATYAKLHATSLALRVLEPEKFESLADNLSNIFYKENVESEEEAKKFDENAKQVFANGLEVVSGHPEASAALDNFSQHANEFFRGEVEKRDKFSCILHGDCWCNNMMFKYKDAEDPSKPTEMCLLDWQISHLGSPILDLSYFFYACSAKEVLYKLPKYLRTYHETFSEVVKEAGLDPEDVLTYEELESQWRKFSKFGLFMALFVMKVILSEVEEAPDLSKLADTGKDIFESITSSKSVNTEAANKRIFDIIVFMTEFGYL